MIHNGLDSFAIGAKGNPYIDNPYYQRRQSTTPSAMGLAQLVMAQQGGGGSGGGGGPAPAGGGDDIEIIYGGNRFNPTSNDATHQGHLHFAMQKGIVPVGRKLEELGFDVGEHPKFGGVAPVHTSGSHHYNRDAIDVNYNGGGRWANEDKALTWLERWLARNYG